MHRTSEEPGGLFGIGLRVETMPPHKVQRITQILQPNREPIKSVSIGDSVIKVDGVPLDHKCVALPKNTA